MIPQSTFGLVLRPEMGLARAHEITLLVPLDGQHLTI
jgi:hypothetical protein